MPDDTKAPTTCARTLSLDIHAQARGACAHASQLGARTTNAQLRLYNFNNSNFNFNFNFNSDQIRQ